MFQAKLLIIRRLQSRNQLYPDITCSHNSQAVVFAFCITLYSPLRLYFVAFTMMLYSLCHFINFKFNFWSYHLIPMIIRLRSVRDRSCPLYMLACLGINVFIIEYVIACLWIIKSGALGNTTRPNWTARLRIVYYNANVC